MSDDDEFKLFFCLTFAAGIAIGLFMTNWTVGELKNEAIQRGYAEYIIKDKQAVWQWKENK